MALDSRWVDAIHSRLLVRYGALWLNQWSGVAPELVKADWAQELAPFADMPEAIKHALEHLPDDKPPTVAAFKRLCVQSPRMAPPALPAPTASAEVVKAAIAKALGPKSDTDPKSWAWKLRKREMECGRLTPAQRSMWREALKVELAQREAA
jgi:hypothetical protein